MTGLENFKQQYPQYKSIPDQELADKLHAKYYSSLPKEEYYSKLGLKTAPKESTLKTLGRNIFSGLEDIGLGAFQTGAEIASKLPIGEENKMKAKSFVGAVSDVKKEKAIKEAQNPANDSFTASLGKFIPKAAVGLGGGLIGGSALSAATTPKTEEESGLTGRAIDTAEMAVAGKVIGEGLKVGTKLFDKAANLISPKVSKEAVEQFKAEGIKPTLGQVSDSNIVKYAEAGLEKFPGSSGVIQKAKENTFNKVQQQIRNVADATPVSGETAGQVIQEGARHEVARFKRVSEKVFGRLDRYVKKDEAIVAPNISKQIDDIVEALPREEAARKLAQDTTVFDLMKDLKTDLTNNGGKLDYKTAKFYRSRIGSEINQKYIVGDTETAQLKQLYGSLSKDMEGAFKNKGDEAQKAFRNANEFYANGVQNIENKLTKIIKSNYPEKVFNAALEGTKEGGTRMRAIMKTLDPESRTLLQSTVLNKLGQNKSGEFVPEIFYNNYKALEGKNALLSRQQITSLDNLTKVLKNVKSVSGKTNTSNTQTMQNLTALGIGGFAGGIPGAVAAAKVVGGAYLTAKLFTNPTFINWLAQAPKLNTEKALSKHIEKLAIIASKNPDLQPDIEGYLKSLNQ